MKNALISPMECPINYISGWTIDTSPKPIYTPIYTPIENSCRVAQVEPDGQTFEIALPLFWTACEDDVVADKFYYNVDSKQIYPIPEPAPYPI